MTPREDEALRRRRSARNLAMGLLLGGLAVLFYAITVARMKL